MNPVQYLLPYPFNIRFIIYRPLTPKFYKWSSPTGLATKVFCLFLLLVCAIRPVHLLFHWLDYAKNTVFRTEYNVWISWLCSFLQFSLTSSRLRPLSKSKYSLRCPFLKNLQPTFPVNATPIQNNRRNYVKCGALTTVIVHCLSLSVLKREAVSLFKR